MRVFLYFITIILFASGCQILSGGNSKEIMETADISIIKASKTHIIDVEVDQNLESILSEVYFYNITDRGNRYILVSGSIRKPIGVSIDRKKIHVRFLNDKGDILSEKIDRVFISRKRRPTGSKGRFSIRVPYNSEVRKCIIAFEAKST